VKLVKFRNRWRVIFEPDSDVERMAVHGAEDRKNGRATGPIFDWLYSRVNVAGAWRYQDCIRLKHDLRIYTGVHFENEDEATLFLMRWGSATSDTWLEPVRDKNEIERAHRQIDAARENKFALVFPEGSRSRYWPKVRHDGKQERWHYAVHKNAAGWFIGWRAIYDPKTKFFKVDEESVFARRKKKDVIARVKRRAGAL
jgi:hypothetical protein